ncbi:ABC-F family ATP-binding cassette domain-containing protein [Streptomyces tsukubensis]|uniref:ABC transporter ATP-binding protein n=1 Tax=Streptomyces tsukubensis TaxID=83656 RepID=A0A1V4A740_9ACTN|nr:ABC-F family ATP-binding cassette domain-containing protein [Streptomyces tsukubensis]OON77332.1 ABC transporter ATP-binding protein [Streptomyces tsukubensis]QFR92409.1 ATP-binding cassette domain-containing protein [Streptomyces tsukubensis]
MSRLVLRDVSFGHPLRPVLDQVSLTVRPGEKTGVIGENGAGKTTLLRLIAGLETPARGEVSVAADGGTGLLHQTPRLPPRATVTDAMEDALGEIRELEGRIHAAEETLGSATPAELSAYGDLLADYEARDGYRARARLEAALHGLSVPYLEGGRPLGSLSGGEAARLALACVLAPSPELLLLDEPTNHLDDEALGWLEERLRGHRGTVVAVTHDRAFLDRVAGAIIEVDGDRRKVARYGGGWPGYLQQRTTARHRWERQYREWSAEAERQERIAESASARLASGWRLSDSPAFAGHQRSVQGQLSGTVRQAREKLRGLRAEPVARPPEPLRFTASVEGGGHPFFGPVELTGVRVGDRLSVERLSLPPGSRTLVMGGNGAGKSTLLNVLAGLLTPDSGETVLPPRVGHLPQESEAVLPPHVGQPGRESEAVLPPHAGQLPQEGARSPRGGPSLLAAFAAGLGGTPEEHREELLSLGLFRAEDLELPVGALSAGQRRRLTLASLVSHPADLLLLDEPANHLSPALVEELDEALSGYAGTLVVVSHDRRTRERFEGGRLLMAGGRIAGKREPG